MGRALDKFYAEFEPIKNPKYQPDEPAPVGMDKCKDDPICEEVPEYPGDWEPTKAELEAAKKLKEDYDRWYSKALRKYVKKVGPEVWGIGWDEDLYLSTYPKADGTIDVAKTEELQKLEIAMNEAADVLND